VEAEAPDAARARLRAASCSASPELLLLLALFLFLLPLPLLVLPLSRPSAFPASGSEGCGAASLRAPAPGLGPPAAVAAGAKRLAEVLR
jgi:hypothetical protein